ncbi:MAG TPA: hypothetical protein VD862_03740 [Candidatus Paceibacterota bacterium]|nr:hypothetical protein [Candidatus Paceibacterota bacterium]
MQEMGVTPEGMFWLGITLAVAFGAVYLVDVFVRRLFRVRYGVEPAVPAEPRVTERSQGRTELTASERRYIEVTKGKCPDCDGGKLLQGPEGGACMNVLCAGCGAKFNLAFGFGGILFGSRIGEPTGFALTPEEGPCP